MFKSSNRRSYEYGRANAVNEANDIATGKLYPDRVRARVLRWTGEGEGVDRLSWLLGFHDVIAERLERESWGWYRVNISKVASMLENEILIERCRVASSYRAKGGEDGDGNRRRAVMRTLYEA